MCGFTAVSPESFLGSSCGSHWYHPYSNATRLGMSLPGVITANSRKFAPMSRGTAHEASPYFIRRHLPRNLEQEKWLVTLCPIYRSRDGGLGRG